MTRPVILGIAGGSASGKSSIAAGVREALGDRCLHILHDRYYKSLPVGVAPSEFNFDEPAALDTHLLVQDLARLLAGEVVELPRYHYASHRRMTETDRVTPHPVILVEGILVLADEALRALFDHSAYVTCSEGERLRRRIDRDVAMRGRTPEDIRAQFEATVAPMHARWVRPSQKWAEVVLDGTRPVSHSVGVVLSLLG